MSDARMTPAGRKAAEKSGTHYIGPDKGADDTSATDRAKAQDTTRLGAKAEVGFPSRKDYGSDPEYHKAIAAFRAKQRGQKDALK